MPSELFRQLQKLLTTSTSSFAIDALNQRQRSILHCRHLVILLRGTNALWNSFDLCCIRLLLYRHEWAESKSEVKETCMNHQVSKTKVKLVEDDGAKLMQSSREAMNTKLLRGDTFELCGVNVWLFSEPVGSSMLSQVSKHEVNLKREGSLELSFIEADFDSELANIIQFYLFFTIPNEKASGGECAVLVHDVSRYEVVVVCACRLGLLFLFVHGRTRGVGIWYGIKPLIALISIQPGLQMVQSLVEKVNISEAFEVQRNFHNCAQRHSHPLDPQFGGSLQLSGQECAEPFALNQQNLAQE
jgi:hypothetical protein